MIFPQDDLQMGLPKKSIRIEIAGIILVVALAIATAFLAKLMGNENYIPSGYLLPIYVIIIVVTGYVWIRIFTAILEKVVQPTIGMTKSQGIKNLFYIVAAIVIVVMVSSLYGLNITAVLESAGFAGIVLGLAAQQVLGNIFAGLSLLASRPFEIGDRITLATASYSLLGGTYPRESTINGFTGVVVDIGIIYTKMTLDGGSPAIFSNSAVVGSMVVNHSRVFIRSVRVRIDLDKKLDYNTFKSKFLDSIKKYEIIDAEKSSAEIVDVGSSTYQIVMIVWARSAFEEPIKTIMIQEALKIQHDMMEVITPQ
jgi:small conductance mechanosensitive channel